MDYKEDWLKEMQILGYSRYTILNYRNDLSKLGKNIDYNKLRNVVLETLGNIPNLRSRSRALSCYKSLSRWLFDNEYTDKDILRSVKSIKVPKVLPKIKDVQIQKTHIYNLSKNKRNLYLIILDTLYQTGVRVGELSNLTLEQVKEDSLIIMGKGSKEREIPIDKELSRRIREKFTKHGHFPSTSQIFRICKKYTVGGISPHSFRHVFATRMAKSGANSFQIASILGHSSSKTSEIYIHLVNSDLKGVIEKANETISK